MRGGKKIRRKDNPGEVAIKGAHRLQSRYLDVLMSDPAGLAACVSSVVV